MNSSSQSQGKSKNASFILDERKSNNKLTICLVCGSSKRIEEFGKMVKIGALDWEK